MLAEIPMLLRRERAAPDAEDPFRLLPPKIVKQYNVLSIIALVMPIKNGFNERVLERRVVGRFFGYNLVRVVGRVMTMETGRKSQRDQLAKVRDIVLIVIGSGIILLSTWWALGRIGNVVFVVLMALMFEITLSPVVDRLTGRFSRPWTVLIVMALVVLILGGGGGYLLTVMTGQIAALVGRLPVDFQRLQTLPWFRNTIHELGPHISVLAIENRIFSSVGQLSTVVLTQTVNVVTQFVDGIVDGAIILFITVYLLLDAERIQSAIVRLVPEQHKEGLLAVEHTLGRVIGGYVRGQVSLSLMIGSAFGIGSWLIGLPYPLVIGVVAGLMELIPLLGPILGAILPIILAFFSNPWVEVPEVLVLLGAVHLLESQILAPRIIRSYVGLHPVLSVVALMIGAELQGVTGALFAVPVAGIIVAAWVAAVRVWREKVVLPSQSPNPEEMGSRSASVHSSPS